jgi:hypothetical protein
MSSEKQIAASRANGAKSRGPVSEFQCLIRVLKSIRQKKITSDPSKSNKTNEAKISIPRAHWLPAAKVNILEPHRASDNEPFGVTIPRLCVSRWGSRLC